MRITSNKKTRTRIRFPHSRERLGLHALISNLGAIIKLFRDAISYSANKTATLLTV